MTAQTFQIALFLGLAGLLCWSIITDLRERIIPNWSNAVIALAAPVYWWLIGLHWNDVAFQIAFAGVCFGFFLIPFAMNAMGGGDVKLIGALALWFPVVLFIKILFFMSLIGGAITLLLWGLHYYRKEKGRVEVPYGVAIALAALWGVYERNLNHFV